MSSYGQNVSGNDTKAEKEREFVTYGEFLRHCQQVSKCPTKTEFAKLIGMRDPDHLIGAMNDRPGKEPSLDLLERAARAIGAHFQDYIQIPKQKSKTVITSEYKIKREDQAIIRQLIELMQLNEKDVGEWIRGNIKTFHRAYLRRG